MSRFAASPPEQDTRAALPPAMKTMVLDVEPAAIALLKAVVESYDNLATLRTQDPRHHLLKLWFDPMVEDEVSALIDSLAQCLRVRRLAAAN